jgi:hypothetical protein
VRNVFLALLFANLLAFGWHLWIVPPEVPASRLVRLGTEPELTLAGAGQVGPATSPSASASPPAAAAGAPRCLRIGPLADGGVADAVSQRLQQQGIVVAQSSEEGQIWVGHWVQLENVGDRAQAERTVARLSAGGLPDAYVLQAAGPATISLGVFRSQERADKVVADARRLGFSPVVTDRYRVGVQFWLLARLRAGERVPVAELARESGQILRSEPVSCAGPTGIGGVARIN